MRFFVLLIKVVSYWVVTIEDQEMWYHTDNDQNLGSHPLTTWPTTDICANLLWGSLRSLFYWLKLIEHWGHRKFLASKKPFTAKSGEILTTFPTKNNKNRGETHPVPRAESPWAPLEVSHGHGKSAVLYKRFTSLCIKKEGAAQSIVHNQIVHITYYILHIAYCILHIAYYILHIHYMYVDLHVCMYVCMYVCR